MKHTDFTTKPVGVSLAISRCTLTATQEIREAIVIAVLPLSVGAHARQDSIP